MNESIVCTIDLQDDHIAYCRMALSTIYMLNLDLSTDFSRLVYNSNLVNIEELEVLHQRIKDSVAGDKFKINEAELVLLYTCHYLANCFAQDKEAYYKWFLEYEKGEVDDSNDMRCVLLDVQMMNARVIEDIGLCEEAIDERKRDLLRIFGACRDRDGREEVVV